MTVFPVFFCNRKSESESWQNSTKKDEQWEYCTLCATKMKAKYQGLEGKDLVERPCYHGLSRKPSRVNPSTRNELGVPLALESKSEDSKQEQTAS